MVARKPIETGRKSKYTPDMPTKLYMLVVECGMASRNGEILWGKIGKVLGVVPSTMHDWRNPDKPAVYHKEFHKSAKAAKEAVDAGAIKRGIIDLAKPHKVYDRTFELRKVGPTCPPKYWRLQDLIEWADEHLDLVFEKGMTKPDVYLAIQREVFEQTEEKQVETKTRVTEALDVGAAKLALANIGPEEERWMDKKDVHITDKKASPEQCKKVADDIARNFE